MFVLMVAIPRILPVPTNIGIVSAERPKMFIAVTNSIICREFTNRATNHKLKFHHE